MSTKLAGVRKSLTTPSPNDYVESSIKTIGSQNVTNGCLIHNIEVIYDLLRMINLFKKPQFFVNSTRDGLWRILCQFFQRQSEITCY